MAETTSIDCFTSEDLKTALTLKVSNQEALSGSKRYENPERSDLHYSWLDMSALHWAATYSHSKSVEVLLRKGHDPDSLAIHYSVINEAFTAMQPSSTTDHGEVIDVLLRYRADPWPTAGHKQKPLHIMSIYNKQASEPILSSS